MLYMLPLPARLILFLNTHGYRYKARCLEAMRSERGKVMSIIIDKMDSNHCKCPYLGTQVSFSHPLSIGITGVLEHGVGTLL